MPKQFYTEKDIEDLFKSGVMSLEVNDHVVLTELAYEKAGRLGLQLLNGQPDNPPSAPVRPYISQKSPARPAAGGVPAPVTIPAPASQSASMPARLAQGDVAQRVREAVIARLGNQVDPKLLDVIIQRVLKSTGLK